MRERWPRRVIHHPLTSVNVHWPVEVCAAIWDVITPYWTRPARWKAVPTAVPLKQQSRKMSARGPLK